MRKFMTYNRKSLLMILFAIGLGILFLIYRLVYLMVLHSENYAVRAAELHERERSIKAERGTIYDRTGKVIAANKPVCTISVIHNQITDKEQVIKELSSILELDEATVRKRVEKYSSIERIRSNVPKETADKIRDLALPGVMVDEDYKRYYPYGELASHVLGFTGSDNQGIIGLEVKYDSLLQGTPGKILTLTTAHGLEIENAAEGRREPIAGNSLHTSLDVTIQMYTQQVAAEVLEAKSAKSVRILVMNPQNGELYALVNYPEFDLNQPYQLTDSILGDKKEEDLTTDQTNALLNTMWRNSCISDTYEPGSAFKIFTATACLEEKVVSMGDRFFCPGFRVVADRRIRCHKVAGHGSEDFLEGIKNSCNPVFIDIGARLGKDKFLTYFDKLGLSTKTGIDLPGEASSIMHKAENIKEVELATMSFGQSFQITPLQLMVAVSAVANGGTLVTPHFGVTITNAAGEVIDTLEYKTTEQVVSKETSEIMKEALEKVVSEGTGNRAYLEGYQVAGKTATSEKLPRSLKKYIASFIGFAPAKDPKVMALVLIDEPEGIYYGGSIAAPVIKKLFDNILPYLGIEAKYSDQSKDGANTLLLPNFIGLDRKEVEKQLLLTSFGDVYSVGEGEVVKEQFPEPGETVSKNSGLILYWE